MATNPRKQSHCKWEKIFFKIREMCLHLSQHWFSISKGTLEASIQHSFRSEKEHCTFSPNASTYFPSVSLLNYLNRTSTIQNNIHWYQWSTQGNVWIFPQVHICIKMVGQGSSNSSTIYFKHTAITKQLETCTSRVLPVGTELQQAWSLILKRILRKYFTSARCHTWAWRTQRWRSLDVMHSTNLEMCFKQVYGRCANILANCKQNGDHVK